MNKEKGNLRGAGTRSSGGGDPGSEPGIEGEGGGWKGTRPCRGAAGGR
jgi:hypothetical protein